VCPYLQLRDAEARLCPTKDLTPPPPPTVMHHCKEFYYFQVICPCVCHPVCSYVMKKPDYAPPKTSRATLDPLQLLDYRCHLPAGKQALGTDYPKPVSTLSNAA
jgi:hypothetical protein